MTQKLIVKNKTDSYYSEIKDKLINNEIYKSIKDYSKNRNDLTTYYEVGKLLSEAGKHYGEGIIKKYSIKLTEETGKTYSVRTLLYMRKFYNFQKTQPTAANLLSWSHYIELLKLKNNNEINYYIKITKEQNLSRDKLRNKIKSKEYERLDNKTKEKLIQNNNVKNDICDFILNPIVINTNKDIINEKALQMVILENIADFMKNLGSGYSFIDSEYKIKVGDNYNRIDILLFNYIYNCFVVVELKINKLKKQDIGQIEFYMNYINNNLKTIYQNNTVGIIVSKENDKYIIGYCSNPNVYSTTYRINKKN